MHVCHSVIPGDFPIHPSLYRIHHLGTSSLHPLHPLIHSCIVPRLSHCESPIDVCDLLLVCQLFGIIAQMDHWDTKLFLLHKVWSTPGSPPSFLDAGFLEKLEKVM